MKRFVLYLVFVTTLTGSAWAQQSNPLKITLKQAPVNLPEGRKAEWDENGNLMTSPGDLVLFTLMAENTGAENAHNVEVVDPIPFGTEYVIGSAKGKNTAIVFSIDGGNTYVEQPTIEVKDEQGRLIRKQAPASMYTHVKWVIQDVVQPKEKRPLDLQVKILTN